MKKGNEFRKPSGKGRIVLHIDMNAFYCSVHEAVDPDKYRGKPLAVSGSVEMRKGVIVTSSYAARRQGVQTGMLVSQAMRICPQLIVIQPNFDLYRQFSKQFMKIIYDFSPLVEPVSIDECFADISGSSQFGSAEEIAATIQRRIREEQGLPCSIGIAPNKLLAKMASDMKKPNGISILRIRDVPHVLWGKPCSELFGIGRKTAAKLEKLGIRTIGELAHTDEQRLVEAFGVNGSWLKQAANGIDHSPVNPMREQSKSIGHTTTLPYDFTDLSDIRRVFLNLADQVARRMRKQGLIASTVQITVRDPKFRTITRSVTLPVPTESADEIHRQSCRLFEKYWKPGDQVRLLGITLQNLSQMKHSAIQLDLFDYDKQPGKALLNQTLDRLRDKYGEDAILTAGMLGNDPSSLIRNHKLRGTSLQMDHLRNKEKESDSSF